MAGLDISEQDQEALRKALIEKLDLAEAPGIETLAQVNDKLIDRVLAKNYEGTFGIGPLLHPNQGDLRPRRRRIFRLQGTGGIQA